MLALITPPVQEHVDKHRETLDKRTVTIWRQIKVLKITFNITEKCNSLKEIH